MKNLIQSLLLFLFSAALLVFSDTLNPKPAGGTDNPDLQKLRGSVIQEP
ncbi:MAG: hypothetical protein L6Q77_08535 [Bacteroidetes bacterium]|nr:hypothetical protein [Bacteroidota bacterium]